MLNQFERALWYVAFVQAGIEEAAPNVPMERIELWAHSMSMIAEQFSDLDDKPLRPT